VAGQGEAGSELQLEERGMRVTATLRDYLGAGELIETHLTGTLSETKAGVCRIYLSGKNKTGRVKLDGQIEITRFEGTATRRIGKDVFSHTISLKRQLPSEAPQVGQMENLAAVIVVGLRPNSVRIARRVDGWQRARTPAQKAHSYLAQTETVPLLHYLSVPYVPILGLQSS